jgi:hypothetical protein
LHNATLSPYTSIYSLTSLSHTLKKQLVVLTYIFLRFSPRSVPALLSPITDAAALLPTGVTATVAAAVATVGGGVAAARAKTVAYVAATSSSLVRSATVAM